MVPKPLSETARLEVIVVAIRPKMSRELRAKQFMPFAALKGYEEALAKKEKIIVPKIEITDDYAEELDLILKTLEKGDMVTVIYYSDQEYIKFTGIFVKADIIEEYIQIVNRKIPVKDIYSIEKQI